MILSSAHYKHEYSVFITKFSKKKNGLSRLFKKNLKKKKTSLQLNVSQQLFSSLILLRHEQVTCCELQNLHPQNHTTIRLRFILLIIAAYVYLKKSDKEIQHTKTTRDLIFVFLLHYCYVSNH